MEIITEGEYFILKGVDDIKAKVLKSEVYHIRNARAYFKKHLNVEFESPLNKIGEKSVNSFSSYNNINYHILEGQKNLRLTLRGQPKIDSETGVTRVYLSGDEWIVEGSYVWDAVVSSNRVECQVEGTVENVKELWIHSEEKGWITIPIENGNFKKCHWTSINNTYMYPRAHLDTPKDITDVFVK
jgi:hypothetical protein